MCQIPAMNTVKIAVTMPSVSCTLNIIVQVLPKFIFLERKMYVCFTIVNCITVQIHLTCS